MSSPRNKFEKKIFDQLKKAKVKFGYETHKVPYVIEANYVPDFVLDDGNTFLETKGYLRPSDRRKLRCVRLAHPTKRLCIVFQRASESYQRWAEKAGWEWAEGSVPASWLEPSKKEWLSK